VVRLYGWLRLFADNDRTPAGVGVLNQACELVRLCNTWEIAIYSAALIAASTRLIAKDTATFPFVHREMFTLVAGLALVSCVALYSGIKTAILFSLQNTINDTRIARFSIVILIVSLMFSTLVFLLDQQRVKPDVIGILAHQEKQLDNDFDKTGTPQ